MGGQWILEAGRYGPRMTMTGPWSASALKALEKAGIKEIELNYAKGWAGREYSFLRDLSDLKAVEIIDRSTGDVSAVNELVKLRYLSLQTYCKTALDFSRWPRLEECALEWRPKARSLFSHRGITRLFINKYRGRDLTDYSGMTQLNSLKLYSPMLLETCRGIESLTRLTWLEFALATKLTSLSGIESLSELQHLEVHTCRRIHDISAVGKLRKLTEFYLLNGGEIDTIAPLRDVKNLEQFLFYESTNILDGDLSVLESLPRLKQVAFMERPHYSHRRGELPTS